MNNVSEKTIALKEMIKMAGKHFYQLVPLLRKELAEEEWRLRVEYNRRVLRVSEKEYNERMADINDAQVSLLMVDARE